MSRSKTAADALLELTYMDVNEMANAIIMKLHESKLLRPEAQGVLVEKLVADELVRWAENTADTGSEGS